MTYLAVDPEEVLAVIENRDREEHPVMSTGDVAEHFDVSRRTINNRLRELVDDGEIRRVDTGSAPVFLLADETIAERDPDDRTDDEPEEPDGRTDLATDGALRSESAAPEVVEVRDGVRELREAIVQIQDNQERVEESVARLASNRAGADTTDDQSPTPWGERIANQANLTLQAGFGLFAVGGMIFLLFIVGQLAFSSILDTTIPVLGDEVGRVLAGAMILSLLAGAVFVPLSIILRLIDRTAFPETAESWYRDIRGDDASVE